MSPIEIAYRLQLEREWLESIEGPLSPAGIRALCARLADIEVAARANRPGDDKPGWPLDTILTKDDGHDTLDTMTTSAEKGAAISAGHRAGRPREATIRHLLKQTGLGSIAQVAFAIGVSPSMLSRVIAGEKRLGAEKAAALQTLIDQKKNASG